MNLKRTLLFLVLVSVFFSCSTLPEEGPDPEKIALIEKSLNDGWTSLWSDDFDAASSSFNDVLLLDGGNAAALRGKGLALYSLGDYRGATDLLLSSVELQPSSPFTVAVCDFVFAECPYSLETQDRLLGIYEKLSELSNPLNLKREGALGRLSYYNNVVLDRRKTEACRDELGRVGGWSILGPFPNTSGSGHDKAFIDEEAPVDKDRTYIGKNNFDIRWHEPTYVSPTGYLHLSDYTSYRNSTSYAAAEIEVESSGEYFFIFEQGGALKFWIDGELILSDSYARYGSDLQWACAELEQGSHRLLVKVSGEYSRAGFALSIERNSTGGADIIDDFRSLAVKDPEYYFWNSYMLNVKGYPEESLSAAESGREVSGGGALFDLLDYLYYQDCGRTAKADGVFQRIRNRDVFFAPATAAAIERCLDEERWEDADELISDAKKKYGDWFYGSAYGVLRKILTEGELAAAELIEGFYEEYPGSPWLDLHLLRGFEGPSLYSFSEIIGNISDKGLEGIALYRRMKKNYYAEYYTAAFTLASELRKHRPHDAEVRKIFLESGIYSGNIALMDSAPVFDEAVENFPLDSGIWKINALRSEFIWNSYLLAKKKNIKTSISAEDYDAEKLRLTECCEVLSTLNPDNSAYFNNLRELNKQPSSDELAEGSDVFEVIAEYEDSDFEVSDDAVIVFDEDVDVYLETGTRIHNRQKVYKILSPQGVRDFSTRFLEFNPSYDDADIKLACVMKEDGTRIGALRSGARLTFPGLAAGDYIVLSYSCFTGDSGTFTADFWGHLLLNDIYPVFSKVKKILYPKKIEFAKNFHNTEDLKYKENYSPLADGMEEYTLSAERILPVRAALFSPGWQDVFAWADFSTIESWSDISSWYFDISDGRCRPTPEIRKLTEALVSDAATDTDKIGAVFNYVSSGIIYEDLAFQYAAHVPQYAQSVIDDGYGDCKDQSVLLVSMLRCAGIDAALALSLPDYHGESAYLPAPRFSHVFVTARADGRELILDPTGTHFTFPEQPEILTGTYMLPVLPEAESEDSALVKVKPSETSQASWTVSLLSVEDEYSSFQTTGLYHGTSAAEIRSLLSSEDRNLNSFLFDIRMESSIPGFILDRLDYKNITDLSVSPLVSSTGRIENILTSAGRGSYTLELPWTLPLPSALLSDFSPESRDTGLFIDFPSFATPQKETIIVRLPAEYKPASVPENVFLSFGDARAVFRYEISGREIICEKEIYLPPMHVGSDDFSDFHSFASGIARQEESLLRLETTIPSPWIN